jgi:hypothetical protein
MVCSKLSFTIGTWYFQNYGCVALWLVLEGHQINQNNHLLSSGLAGGKLEAIMFPFARQFFCVKFVIYIPT